MKYLLLLYFLVIELRNLLYKLRIFKIYEFKDLKIISVGNITTGGTGKTPTVIKVAEELVKKNKNVAIITRGYKRKSKKEIIVAPNQTDFNIEEIGDEPFMIKKNLPNIWLGVGANRKNLIEKLQKITKLDYVVLDDGFQKLQIKKDLNILLIDATNPFDNGLIREPLKNIRRADVILLTKTNFVDDKNLLEIEETIKKYSNVKIIQTKYIPKKEDFQDKFNEISMITAIANPKGFETTLNDLGIKIKNKYIFPDHYWFKKEDLESISDEALITTEKDFVKLKRFENIKKFYVVKIIMDFDMDLGI